MVDPNTYIKEGLKIVKTLASQGNLQAALNACRELSRVNPYDRSVEKMLKEIEETALKKNIEKVDADISATMHLWDEGKFEDLAKIYAELYKYAPNYDRLKKLIVKLDEKMSGRQKDQKNEFVARALAAIKKLTDEKNYPDAIRACYELMGLDPLNETARAYVEQAKNALIEQKLRENEKIMDSADFERALNFYEPLLAVNPDHPRVKQLVLQAKENLAHQRLLAEKIHLNESIVRMKDLFSASEYEKVIQACEEIDRLDPRNLTARIFKKKARAAMEDEADFQIVKKMKEENLEAASEYQKNPQEFATI